MKPSFCKHYCKDNNEAFRWLGPTKNVETAKCREPYVQHTKRRHVIFQTIVYAQRDGICTGGDLEASQPYGRRSCPTHSLQNCSWVHIARSKPSGDCSKVPVNSSGRMT